MAQDTSRGSGMSDVPAFPSDNNPASVSEPSQPPGPTVDGETVSPAVARSRQGGAAAHGHGPGGSGPGGN